MPIWEYKCADGHLSEIISVNPKSCVAVITCACGKPAERITSVTNWQIGSGPKESPISAAIQRVKKAERQGLL